MQSRKPATSSLLAETDAATREEASRILEQWTNFFKQAIDLPPKDVKSRDVIARAYSRLGYAHWMLSFSKGTGAGPDPGLLAEAVSDFHRSVDLLEKLLAESPGDTGIRRHLAEAMGVANMGCCLMSAGRADEASPTTAARSRSGASCSGARAPAGLLVAEPGRMSKRNSTSYPTWQAWFTS